MYFRQKLNRKSKQRIFPLCLDGGIPRIAAMGRKGGSNVAASICNALMYTVLGTLDPHSP